MALFTALSAVLSEAIIDLDGTFLIQLAIFIVLFFVLRSFVFKPMIALFAAREAAIDGARDEAKKMEAEARHSTGGFDEAIQKVRISASEERDRLRNDGLKLERTLLESVRVETQKTMDSAKTTLEGEARIVRNKMTTDTPALAKQIASKLLGREVA
jgi:F-type H+-transporting ATPase subunit b